jgi:hypothetical protein
VPGSTSIALVNIGGSLGIVCLLAMGCRSAHDRPAPSIEFTHLPPSGQGSGEIIHTIEGRVTGARPGQRIVLYARSGVWWVQPDATQMFTAIQPDSRWKNTTHPGSAYAALLVDPEYSPPLTANVLPEKGGLVRAVVTAEEPELARPPYTNLQFSGYEWLVRATPGSPGGSRNSYDSGNAWVDEKGFLHLRIARSSAGWTSAEVGLARSLGYGSYRFVVSDISQLEPAAVLTISNIDDSVPNAELDIEISRWGESGGKNSQYVVQPYYVPANVVRFQSPAGRLTYSYDWEPGRASFRTVRGSEAEVVAAHTFTSGVPPTGRETARLNLYVFNSRTLPMRDGVEVVIEKFEYLP